LTSAKGGPYDDPATALAIRRYEERLARDPESLAFATLADLYRKVGRIPEAIALCRDGLRRVPHYTTARLILAKTLLAAGELVAARTELEAIAEGSPGDAECHRLLADLHRRRGDLEASVRHLETAVRLDPGDRDAKAALRLLRPGPGGVPEGGLGRILRDDLFVTATFGAVCLEQGLVEEAADIFGRLLRRDPADQRARDGLEQVLRAKSGRKRG
jgi:tetratricopeptide (TPR) repeat protein